MVGIVESIFGLLGFDLAAESLFRAYVVDSLILRSHGADFNYPGVELGSLEFNYPGVELGSLEVVFSSQRINFRPLCSGSRFFTDKVNSGLLLSDL